MAAMGQTAVEMQKSISEMFLLPYSCKFCSRQSFTCKINTVYSLMVLFFIFAVTVMTIEMTLFYDWHPYRNSFEGYLKPA